jgi:NhaP-type Na+/H+ or K+/H+ antiporter
MQIVPLCLMFAFVLVTLSTFLCIPFMLWGLDLHDEGWTWVHAALFSAMVASTDAVAGKDNIYKWELSGSIAHARTDKQGS